MRRRTLCYLVPALSNFIHFAAIFHPVVVIVACFFRLVFLTYSLLMPFIKALSTNDAQVSIDFLTSVQPGIWGGKNPTTSRNRFHRCPVSLADPTPPHPPSLAHLGLTWSFIFSVQNSDFLSVSGCCPAASVGGAVTALSASRGSLRLNCNSCSLPGSQLSLSSPELQFEGLVAFKKNRNTAF